MKKVLFFFLALAVIIGKASASFASQEMPKVAIWSWDLSSSLLNQAYQGTLDGIKQDGYTTGQNIIVDTYDVGKNAANAPVMFGKIKSGNYDVIVSVGTTGSKYLLDNAVTLPVVFSVVTDPVKSGIVASWEDTKNNFTGTSNKQSIEKQILSFKEIYPNVKRLGMIYKDAESNSLVQVEEVKSVKDKLGLTEVVTSPAKDADDLARAAQELVGKVDAVFLPADTTVGSVAAEKIVNVLYPHKIPVFSANEPPISVGVLTGVCSDYYRLGVQTWDMTKKIIKGAKPQNMPVEIQQVPNFIVNIKAAEKLGIEIPPEVFDKVTKVYE